MSQPGEYITRPADVGDFHRVQSRHRAPLISQRSSTASAASSLGGKDSGPVSVQPIAALGASAAQMNRADKVTPTAGDDRASTNSDESLIDVGQTPLKPPPQTTTKKKKTNKEAKQRPRSSDAPLPPYFDDPRLAKLVGKLTRPGTAERRNYASNLTMASAAPRLSLTPSKNSLKNSLGDDASTSRRGSRRTSSVQLIVDKVRADLERRRLGADYRTLSVSSDEGRALEPLSASPSEAGGFSDEEEVHAAGLPDQPDFQLGLLHGHGRRKSRRRRSTLLPQVSCLFVSLLGF